MDKIWNYIKINYKGILRSISLLCIACLVAVLWVKPPQIPNSVVKTIDSLKTVNKELKIQNQQLNSKINGIGLRIDTVNSKLKNNTDQQNLLKLQYDKKLNSISGFSSNDVYNYFIQSYSSGQPQIK